MKNRMGNKNIPIQLIIDLNFLDMLKTFERVLRWSYML